MSIKNLFQAKQGEEIIFVLRRHPLVFLPKIVLFLALTIVPLIAVIQYTEGQQLQIQNPLWHFAGVLFAGLYFLSIWLLFLSQFTDYYLDISIVTNDRILDIEQMGLFGRVISELDLSRIQDVNSEIKGIFPTIFNFGLVEVQTAGEEQMFEFQQISNPHGVRQRIIELAALDRKREARELRQVETEGVVTKKLEELDEAQRTMKDQGL